MKIGTLETAGVEAEVKKMRRLKGIRVVVHTDPVIAVWQHGKLKFRAKQFPTGRWLAIWQ